MNEHEVRDALRGAMVASSPPPPMDTGLAVAAGQKAYRRRQTTRAGVVAGLAVVGIAVGATYLPSALGGGSTEAGAGPNGVVPPLQSSAGVPAQAGAGDKTGTSWPDGQTDRTATSGPRADKSVDLASKLAAALPSGFAARDADDAKVRTQSQFVDYAANNAQVWEYQATTPVLKTDGNGHVGTLYVQVTTVGNTVTGEACEAAAHSWGIKGDCAAVDVGGNKVGVLTSNGTEPDQEKAFDQVAAYRYADGTLVLVGQAKAFRDSKQPALGELPLTGDQLAALATDPKFHLD
ncbi:hypothetical protein [Umezawaea sp. NPDC059074]|uniref:hypothetical protein n=1 Tax=Umezawaea sp. NPDC059074 TaxID=3346716 RepID=UPI0036B9CA99